MEKMTTEEMVQRLEAECSHNEVKETMEFSWYNGLVRLEYDKKFKVIAIYANGELKHHYDASSMSIEDFIKIEWNCQLAADQLLRLNPAQEA